MVYVYLKILFWLPQRETNKHGDSDTHSQLIGRETHIELHTQRRDATLRDTHNETETQMERETHWEMHKQRHCESHSEKHTQRDTHTARDTHTVRGSHAH